MSIFHAIVLGIVQGLTEFLPVSSSAHLRIVPAILGWEDPGAAFTAIIQIGTLVAVMLYFAKDITSITGAVYTGIRNGTPFETTEAKTGWMIAVGTLPIVIFGLLFKVEIETTLRSLYWISASMILLALLLSIAEHQTFSRLRQGISGKSIQEIGWKEAVFIGLAQVLALIPGSSRSGVTITGGLFMNLDRKAAARFSFLLSIPSVLSAAIFEIFKNRAEIMASTQNLVELVVATLCAGIVGYISIAFLLNYLRRHTTTIFIAYRLMAGTALIVLIAIGRLQP
jgi:undecaprenyl-diphosphatase